MTTQFKIPFACRGPGRETRMWWWDGPGPGKHKPLLLPTEMGRCRLQLKIHSA